ncbi:MAG TPA: hypothetical protein GXX63_06860 [Tissierellia bacterium]|nr:hypothetical protein [Tissierellia bacterium]
MDNFRVIKVFEDRQNKLILSEQEEKDILSMKSIIGENNLNLQADGKLLIRHYVGFIQVNKTRLLIYPKISNRARDKKTLEKSFEILIKLLSYSDFNSVKRIPSPQHMEKYQGDLLEVFIGFFIDELLFLFKRDVNRNYNQSLENQSFIKGKIDFAETIKKNSYRKHLHYVRFDHFTEDILLNQIFKSVIQNLILRTRIKENRIKLKQALLWLEDVETIHLDNEIWSKVKFTRLNYLYKPVFNLAKLFYYNSSPNLNKGDELTFSFLVPLNKLFEKYLYEILNRSVKDYNIEHEGPVSYLARLNDEKFAKLKPDITIIQDENVKYIIDAKYKEVLKIDNKLQISQSDIYQMLAYSVNYKCNNIALVYPKFLEDKNEDVLVSEIIIDNYGKQVKIKILKINLGLDAKQLSDKLNKIFII